MSDTLGDAMLELEKAGFTRAEIARRFRTTQEQVRVRLRDAKHLNRYGAPAAQSGRSRLGVLLRSPLDQLHNVGDSVTLTKAEGRSRGNVYRLGKNRGWKLKVVSEGECWRVTAQATLHVDR